MSTKMSPVTTFIRGGRPPTPLGQEKPVPCMEQIQRTGSRMVKGSVGGDVAISVGAQQGEETYQTSGRIHITQLHGKSQRTGCSRIIYIVQENTFSILALVSKCAAQLFSAFPNIIYKVHTFQNQFLFFIFLKICWLPVRVILFFLAFYCGHSFCCGHSFSFIVMSYSCVPVAQW